MEFLPQRPCNTGDFVQSLTFFDVVKMQLLFPSLGLN